MRSAVAAVLSGMILVGCSAAMAAPAGAESACTAVLGGNWDDQNGACSSSLTSIRQAIMTLSVGIPHELIDDPTAGPLIRGYLRARVDDWRNTGESRCAPTRPAWTTASILTGRLRRWCSTSIGGQWETCKTTPTARSPSTSHRAGDWNWLTFFKPGVDPLTALAPLARPYLQTALDQAQPPHDPGTYPFTPDNFEPQPDGSGYSSDYRAFAITPDELILYMPDAPMAHENPWPRDRFLWSMDGNTVEAHIPLTALAPILRAI